MLQEGLHHGNEINYENKRSYINKRKEKSYSFGIRGDTELHANLLALGRMHQSRLDEDERQRDQADAQQRESRHCCELG